MARGFTERERENIKRNLLKVGKESWTRYGCKKTSVDELCRQAGISKGAFYLFFESKEALFCEILCSVQNHICEEASKIMKEQRDKCGVVKALKFVYREYDKNNFLYHVDNTDFTVFMNKLSEEQAGRIEEANRRSRELFISHPYMKLKVDADLALAVIYSLIMNIKNKELLPCNHMESFEFMAERLIDSLYE